MKSLQYYIDQMNQLLSELVQVATQLRDMSLQVISQEDLAPLQKHQEELLNQLENADQQLQKYYRQQVEAVTRENFHQQLKVFQTLNQEFIQNLNTSHGLIQFELRRLEEEVDLSRFSHSNKILPSPDSTKAIEAQEDEKS